MTTLETLKAARLKIADEGRWTFGEYARNRNEGPVAPNSPKAYCWCAIGALCVVTRCSAKTILLHPAYDALANIVPRRSIHDFNDSKPHHAVLAAFDEAIAKLEHPNG